MVELEQESIVKEEKVQGAETVVDNLQRRINERDNEVQELKQVCRKSKVLIRLLMTRMNHVNIHNLQLFISIRF